MRGRNITVVTSSTVSFTKCSIEKGSWKRHQQDQFKIKIQPYEEIAKIPNKNYHLLKEKDEGELLSLWQDCREARAGMEERGNTKNQVIEVELAGHLSHK